MLAASAGGDSLLDRSDRSWIEPLVESSRGPLPPLASGSTVGPWTLGRLLGEGGMGSVFLGERRGEGFTQRAAVKLLPGGAHPSHLHQRFLAERGILARLEHPGIARLLDGGVTADGAPYIAMELVEGRTITAACRESRATVEQRLTLFLEVCEAVEYAHRHRVVHRDLKPSNVMVDRNGRARLLDFGIAKLLEPGGETAEQPTLLRALTPQYAAPEQVTGGAITPATDVYALGVLLFELLAGRLPFALADQSSFTVEQAIVGATPARLRQAAIADDTRPEGQRLARRLAGDLERIVQRAMAKEPERRYPSVAALAADLRRHLAGEPVAARGDGIFYRARRLVRRQRWAVLAGALAVVALALGARIATIHPQRSPVLAVLPFAVSGPVEPYRAAALTEEVASALGRSREVAVLATTSLLAADGGALPTPRLRQELGATHLLRGSVDSAAGRLRVRVAVEDLDSGATLGAEELDWDAASPLGADAAIVRRVAGQVLDRLGLDASAATDAPQATRDARAYEAYQRGVAALAGRATEASGAEQRLAATVQLELAVALDPGFASAWARLATVYAQRLFSDAPSADLEQRANVAVQWALALDPALAEAYLARAQLAWSLAHGFPHAQAVADLRRALELQPSLAEAHRELCKVYFHVGLTDRAVAECDRALALDPADRAAFVRKLTALADDGRFADVARALAEHGREISAPMRGGLLLMIRENAAALALLRPAASAARPVDPEFGWPTSARAALERAWAALALARLGRTQEAAALLARAEFSAESLEEQSHLHHAYYAVGAAHAVLGNREEALRWLEKAADEGYPSYPHFAKDADLVSLASEPRFVALLRRLETDWRRYRDTL